MALRLMMTGINHKTAPAAVRERFCLSVPEKERLLDRLKQDPWIAESLVISTCNRTEMYAVCLDTVDADSALKRRLMQVKNIADGCASDPYFYTFFGEDCVRHLFGVACGLDSIILGEKQILGQLKTAVEAARRRGTLSRTLNVLSNVAVRCGKKAQSETAINYGGVSVSWAAVKMAETCLGPLTERSVLVVGAGKTGSIAVEQLRKRSARHVYVANRSLEKACQLARQTGARPLTLEQIESSLSLVDHCICASEAPHYVIDRPLMERVMVSRAGRPLLLLDISMPRNIDPEVSRLDGVRLFAIDDLVPVLEDTLAVRQEAVQQVEQIIAGKLREFHDKLTRLTVAEERRRLAAAVFGEVTQ